ncbi:NADH:ubiquinone/plastoquinone oxidoreductase [Cynara cardunculus var. scolymus]|uniref:NADH:ubiquinone/plastoquinone oxidoreductase n=1 Tax=Cynara cardunculus var. scolymus TaxID=59895 RepID=A0A103YLD2_CYNCS|nr:NADH:ubiquinone/plastoquinone oxidoreductase [Cynara cardunculus var. scolymus]
MGKKYHSSNISKGDANGSASSPIIDGRTLSPIFSKKMNNLYILEEDYDEEEEEEFDNNRWNLVTDAKSCYGLLFAPFATKVPMVPVHMWLPEAHAGPYITQKSYLEKGGQLARATSVVVKLIAKEGKSATLQLTSRKVRLISKNCSATVGQVENVGVNQKSLGRVGSKHWLELNLKAIFQPRRFRDAANNQRMASAFPCVDPISMGT